MRIGVGCVIEHPDICGRTLIETSIWAWVRGIPFAFICRPIGDSCRARGGTSRYRSNPDARCSVEGQCRANLFLTAVVVIMLVFPQGKAIVKSGGKVNVGPVTHI